MSDRAGVFALTCNYLENPVGMDSLPRFSWKVASPARGKAQETYHIRVATSVENLAPGRVDVWDSGRVLSPDSVLVAYDGEVLAPRTRYCWNVVVTLRGGLPAEDGEPGTGSVVADAEADPRSIASQRDEVVSSPAFFETGKLAEPWSARWISAPFLDFGEEETTYGAPQFRESFELPSVPAEGRLYICGMGYHQVSVNGSSPTDEVLAPPFTRYDATLLYDTYDVSSLLRSGENTLAVTLGNGWFNCVTVDPWYTRQASWRDAPKLLCELHVVLQDGTKQVIRSGPDWKAQPGPITFNSIRNGEHYDARLETLGWDQPGFDDTSWPAAVIVRSPGGLLRAAEIEPIRQLAELPAVRKWRTPEKTWIFDIGQNLAGVVRLRMRGRAGTEFVIRHNERLRENGRSLVREGGFIGSGDFQTCRYVKGSDDEEVWEPSFVYFGFQYVEISGFDYEPQLDDVTAVYIHTDLKRRSSFECSSETLNSIVRTADWSTLSNFHGLPTDCPHREKNGWTGDSAVAAEQTIISYASMAAYTKWLRDFLDSQRPSGQIPCVIPSTGWGYNGWNGPDYSSTLTFIPWWLYLYCGDRAILAECYEAMRRHFDFMASMADDNIVCYGGGDWCAPFFGRAYFENMASFKAPKAVTDTGYYHSTAVTLSKIASVLGDEETARTYEERARQIKASFRKAFFDSGKMSVAGDCQTSSASMLYHGLCESGESDALVDFLLRQIDEKEGHLDFGIFGSKAVMRSLGEAGRADVACAMAEKRTYPGWGNWVARGATTLWECWNGEGSRNHQMFSDIVAFFYTYLAGIAPDEEEPGFRHVVLRPALRCGLSWIECSHDSMYGPIGSSWRKTGKGFELEVTLPPGTHGSLFLPSDMDGGISESGRPLGMSAGVSEESDDRGIRLSLQSGKYRFEISRL